MTKIDQVDWDEMVALKQAITFNPASVHPDKMEKFTELFVQSLRGKGNYSCNVDPTNY